MAKIKEIKDEQKLLQQLRNGSMQAFTALYNHYSSPILSKFDRMVPIDTLAEELLQELFVKIWERRAQIDPKQSFSAYLSRIAEHMIVDFYRKAARDKRLQDALRQRGAPTTELPPERDMLYRETQALLEEALSRLSPQRRKAFELCKLQDKSYDETSAIMKVSPHTVRNHIVQANKQIKAYLKDYPDLLMGLLCMTLFSLH